MVFADVSATERFTEFICVCTGNCGSGEMLDKLLVDVETVLTVYMVNENDMHNIWCFFII